MKRILTGLILTVALLATAVLSGCGSSDDSPTVTVTPAFSIDPRRPAADFSGTTLDGAPVSLAGFKGKPTVLIFWASW